MWFILASAGLVLMVTIYSKIEFMKVRDNSEKLLAEVVEYRREKIQKRNDFTRIDYPYVKIETEKNEHPLVRLRYANSSSRSFEIGEKIFVFWGKKGELLYWDAFDKGIYKYLPEKWSFKK